MDYGGWEIQKIVLLLFIYLFNLMQAFKLCRNWKWLNRDIE